MANVLETAQQCLKIPLYEGEQRMETQDSRFQGWSSFSLEMLHSPVKTFRSFIEEKKRAQETQWIFEKDNQGFSLLLHAAQAEYSKNNNNHKNNGEDPCGLHQIKHLLRCAFSMAKCENSFSTVIMVDILEALQFGETLLFWIWNGNKTRIHQLIRFCDDVLGSEREAMERFLCSWIVPPYRSRQTNNDDYHREENCLKGGGTLLHECVYSGCSSIARKLLEWDCACPFVKNIHSETALDTLFNNSRGWYHANRDEELYSLLSQCQATHDRSSCPFCHCGQSFTVDQMHLLKQKCDIMPEGQRDLLQRLVSDAYVCPLTLEIMEVPIRLEFADTRQISSCCYEKAVMERWLFYSKRDSWNRFPHGHVLGYCPYTRRPVKCLHIDAEKCNQIGYYLNDWLQEQIHMNQVFYEMGNMHCTYDIEEGETRRIEEFADDKEEEDILLFNK
jgi:hypothetical protein